jgi:hypothetical protein
MPTGLAGAKMLVDRGLNVLAHDVRDREVTASFFVALSSAT